MEDTDRQQRIEDADRQQGMKDTEAVLSILEGKLEKKTSKVDLQIRMVEEKEARLHEKEVVAWCIHGRPRPNRNSNPNRNRNPNCNPNCNCNPNPRQASRR